MYTRLSILLLFLCSSVLLAQDEDRWEFSVSMGLSGGDSGEFETPVEGDVPRNVGLSFDQGYLIAVRFTQNLGQHFGAELEYVFANQPGSLTNLDPAIPVLDFTHKIHKAAYNVLFYGTGRSNPVRPFVSAGIGPTFFQVSGGQAEADEVGVRLNNQTKFVFNFGGGIKFKVRPSWGVRVDVRDYISGVPDFSLPEEAPAGIPPIKPRGVGFNPDGLLHNWGASLGFNLYFP